MIQENLILIWQYKLVVASYLLVAFSSVFFTLLDIVEKKKFSTIRKHISATLVLLAIVALFSIAVFWLVIKLAFFDVTTHEKTLYASIFISITFRTFIRSKWFSLPSSDGKATSVGFADVYDGLLFFYYDLINSLSKTKEIHRFKDLSVDDLIKLALSYDNTQEDVEKIEKLATVDNGDFKRNWLAKYCAEKESQGSEESSS